MATSVIKRNREGLWHRDLSNDQTITIRRAKAEKQKRKESDK
jgi:hypothetical protein